MTLAADPERVPLQRARPRASGASDRGRVNNAPDGGRPSRSLYPAGHRRERSQDLPWDHESRAVP